MIWSMEGQDETDLQYFQGRYQQLRKLDCWERLSISADDTYSRLGSLVHTLFTSGVW
jgi:hypothetical protein